MFEKLKETELHYLELEAKMSQPDIVSQPELYKQLMIEYSSLSPVVEKFREWERAGEELTQAKTMYSETKDSELRALAGEEIDSLGERIKACEDELKLLLLPKDPLDEKNVIVELRAGAGGEEACLFAAVLYRMYFMYAQSRGYGINILSANETQLGGYQKLVFSVEGKGAYSRFKFEGGVHRVQRVPLTESQGRIQTSTCTVAVLPEAQPVEIDINPADIIFETCKSSGAGGQHINKTESAVRLTHKPSGIVVECQEERSQYKNRDKAMVLLCSRLLAMKRQEQDEKISSERRQMVGSGDRSEKIRTYNYPQNRLTDHRINLTIYDLDSVLNGKLDQVIDPLLTADAAQKMAGADNDS